MDPVRTEVMRNRFAAIAEEASNVAYRTAYTTFVKQTQDYQVALASAAGEFFAYPVRAGVTSSVCQNVRGLVDIFGIDAARAGRHHHHQRPVLRAMRSAPTRWTSICCARCSATGRSIAFGWAFIHASDIGGSVPGSISPTNYEVFQEGVRMRPNLLYRKGVLNEQLWNFFADNSRIPDLIWGDLQAMMAGLALLDERTQELCDRYGTAALLESIDDVLALSELKARAAIATLTDGEYTFNEYLENVSRRRAHLRPCQAEQVGRDAGDGFLRQRSAGALRAQLHHERAAAPVPVHAVRQLHPDRRADDPDDRRHHPSDHHAGAEGHVHERDLPGRDGQSLGRGDARL